MEVYLPFHLQGQQDSNLNQTKERRKSRRTMDTFFMRGSTRSNICIHMILQNELKTSHLFLQTGDILASF